MMTGTYDISSEGSRPPGDLLNNEALSVWIEPIDYETPCEIAYERFSQEPELLALPVVREAVPVGLLNRQAFMVRLADRFGRALFEQKSVTRLMDNDPMIVSDDMTVEALGTAIIKTRPNALLDGFIVTRNGAYRGVGTAFSLLTLTLERARARNHQLDEARANAESASQSKSQFLANMSHELRTPLNAIIGFSDIMTSEMFGPLGHARYGDYARDIGESGRHLLGIINDILDIAKVEAGKLELAEARIDVASVIKSSLRLVRERAAGARVHLVVSQVPKSCVLYGDTRLVKQILLNLLTNAIKFSCPQGTVSIRVCELADGSLRLTVKDQGIGMTAAEIERAMEPFGQVASHLNRTHHGVGLGLPLVKRMVEAHGGTFRIESAPGVGTAATATFPPGRVSAQRPPLHHREVADAAMSHDRHEV